MQAGKKNLTKSNMIGGKKSAVFSELMTDDCQFGEN